MPTKSIECVHLFMLVAATALGTLLATRARPAVLAPPDKTWTVHGVAPRMSRLEVEALCGKPVPVERLPAHMKYFPDILTFSWGEAMVDRRDRIVWVHGDQLEHHGHCLISNGMTRAQVLEKMGQPINPLKRVEATSTEVNYFQGGVSVALVNQHLVFSTVR